MKPPAKMRADLQRTFYAPGKRRTAVFFVYEPDGTRHTVEVLTDGPGLKSLTPAEAREAAREMVWEQIEAQLQGNPRAKFRAVCMGGCYTMIRKEGSKKECEIEATSHGNMFGHDMEIMPVVFPEKNPRGGKKYRRHLQAVHGGTVAAWKAADRRAAHWKESEAARLAGITRGVCMAPCCRDARGRFSSCTARTDPHLIKIHRRAQKAERAAAVSARAGAREARRQGISGIGMLKPLPAGYAAGGMANPPKLIYPQVVEIRAIKADGSRWYHTFKGRGPAMYGLADGSLLIKSRRA